MDGGHESAMRRALRRIKLRGGGGENVEIEIEGGTKEDPYVSASGEADESEPEMPGRVREGGADPDAEIYGEADDDDPELPGVIRSVMKRRNRR